MAILDITVGKIKNIKLAELTLDLEEPISADVYGYEELSLVGPVQFTGKLVNTGGFLELLGMAKGSLQLICSRCLEPFLWEFQLPIAERYTNQQGLLSEEEEINWFEGDKIDIAPQLLKQIFLEMPMQPICKPDCKGLCSNCGANLNLGSCQCIHDEIDLRLEKLKDFFS